MDLLRWMGKMYARFVAVSVVILSSWMFAANLGERGWGAWTLVWILASGLVGTAGGVAYLLSLDGPSRFRTRKVRALGWVAMLLAVLLPTVLTFMLVPLVLLLIPSIFTLNRTNDALTSS